MRTVPLSEVKNDLSRFLREAEAEGIVITRHGKPAGVLIGFESEDDCSTGGLRTIRGSCAASTARVPAYARVAAFDWKI
jgi:prevent-host-death family protein